MENRPRHLKRHGFAAATVFGVVLSAAVFVTFFCSILFGIVPVACSAPLEELAPFYFTLGLLGSFVLALLAAVLTYRRLRARFVRRVSSAG